MSMTEKAGWVLSFLIGVPGALLWATTDDHDSLLGILTFTVPVIMIGVLTLTAVDRLVQPQRVEIQPAAEPVETTPETV